MPLFPPPSKIIIASPEDIETALAGKAPVVHEHQITDVTGLQTALDTKAIASEVENALTDKSDIGHQHSFSDILDFPSYIHRSTTSPDFISFPYGGIWHELTENPVQPKQFRRQTWVKDYLELSNSSGAFWISQGEYTLDLLSPVNALNTSITQSLPFDSRFFYFFKDFIFNCIYDPGNVDIQANYWAASVDISSGVTLASTGRIPSSKQILAPSHLIISPQPNEKILFNCYKFGNPPNAKLGFSVRYHLVRDYII